jgi:hypothetical protein
MNFETPQAVENEFMSGHQWLNKFLTSEEFQEVKDRTGGSMMHIWHFNFTEALFYNFKYLYEPLTEEEWNKWKAVAERAEKQIKDEGDVKLKKFVDSLDKEQLAELKELLKDK